MIFTIIGFVALSIMNGSAIPQLIKTFKTKEVKDLNILREIMLLIGCGLYLVYGIYRKDPVIITSNSIASIMFITLISLQLKYKNVKTR